MSRGEGIVVYCTKGNVMFSSTGDLIPAKPSVRKHRVSKAIIYQEFQEMKELEGDEFWKNLLTKCSKNLFPKDFKYIHNVLYYKPNTKKHRTECFIDKDDILESLEKFKNFMRSRGFVSNSEKEEIKSIIENNVEERSEIKTWKDVLKNKEYHIKNFIIDLKDKYSLTYNETRNLESTVMMGIVSEFFNEDNISIEKEKIKDISNLDWNINKRKFSIITDNIKIKKRSEKPNNKKIYTTHTIETSNDNYIVVLKEAKDMGIEKKWLKFLEIINNKQIN